MDVWVCVVIKIRKWRKSTSYNALSLSMSHINYKEAWQYKLLF